MRTIIIIIFLILCMGTCKAQEYTSTKNNVTLTINNNKIEINRDIKSAVMLYTDDGRTWTFDSYVKLQQRPNRIKGILKHLRFSRTLNLEYSDRKYSFKIQ